MELETQRQKSCLRWWRLSWYCRLQFTSNIRECVRASVERARYFIRHAKPRKTKRKSQNGLPCVCVAFKRIRSFYAHTHAFMDVRSEAQSTVARSCVRVGRRNNHIIRNALAHAPFKRFNDSRLRAPLRNHWAYARHRRTRASIETTGIAARLLDRHVQEN